MTMASKAKKSEVIILKDYSKVILFYPLWIFSIVAMIVEAVNADRPSIAIAWIFFFFINTVIVGFNFPTIKFFVLFLVITLVVMGLILLDLNGVIDLSVILSRITNFFDFSLHIRFYGWIVLTLGIVIFFAFIQAQMHFIKIEKNEIYIRGLTSGKAERFPTANVQIQMEIVDVFELISLGAGSFKIKLNKDTTITLDTVPFVRKKKKQIDTLLSTTLVEQKE